jgi:hypothetical protein
MILWDHNGNPVASEEKDLTPGVANVISGVSDRYDRGSCPFCNRSYSQDISCHHLRNILPVEGDAYWHRAFIKVANTQFMTVSKNDGLEGPTTQNCEACGSSVARSEMIHVMFVEDVDPRIRVVSYCSGVCADDHWQSELKTVQEIEAVQKRL